MASRGLCSVCGGEYAVAQDNTPYKHASSEGDPCPGADQPITALVDEVTYLVYGGEVRDYRHVVIGPVAAGTEFPAEQVVTSDGQAIPLLGTTTSGDRDSINALLPESERIPGPAEE